MKEISIDALDNVTGGASLGTAYRTYDIPGNRRVRLYEGGKAVMVTKDGIRHQGSIVQPFQQKPFTSLGW
jgi:hypothetical protein